MADNERLYTIPLRKEFLKVPRYIRTRKAIKAIRSFAQKHMKTQVVKIGPYLNELMLSRGRKNPPHKVQVRITKEEDKDKLQIVRVELASIPSKKSEEKKNIAEKVDEHKIEEEKEKKEVLETKSEELQKSKSKQIEAAKIPEKAHAHRKREKVVGGEG